uniref:GYDIA family GHMP kinase n=1 Tax=Gelidibacter sp. TaxID=2018083 RepID=UPI00404B64B8
MSQTFYSHGKLLLTAEYVVLDGALALALPTKFGQSLTINPIDEFKLKWKSLDEKGFVWFEETYDFSECVFPFVFEYSTNSIEENRLSPEAKTLLSILYQAHKLNASFLSGYLDTEKGIEVTTKLDFPKNWGLGTSSTLINNIANWANVDAYELLTKTFGGSGYDIACAQHEKAITYQLLDTRIVNEVDFNPEFKDDLYFVYLNKKQNSRDGIAQYKANAKTNHQAISEITDITNQILVCKSLETFETLIETHELIISKLIKQQPIKELFFNDFDGSIKSLGAWGGDFILATSKNNPKTYFKNKGLDVVIPFSDMIL